MAITVFVLKMNNGQSYEDYSEWNLGVYLSKQQALDNARVSPRVENGCEIEEWVIGENKMVNNYSYDVDQIKKETLGPAVNELGFTERYFKSRFTESQLNKFKEYMRGQTTAVVDGETTYYPKDVVDFMLKNPVTD
jgi:hypothetical protein